MRARRLAAALAVAALSFLGAGSRPGAPALEPRQADRLVVLEPADGLGAMVAGFGDLWVDDRARQQVLRVDGRSGRVRAAIPVEGRVALDAGGGAVWALQSGGGYGLGLRGPLLRIDPRTDRIRARIALGRAELGFGVEAAGANVWVWGPHAIVRIDGRARRVVSRIAVGYDHGELTGLAAGPGQLVAGTADGHFLRFDSRTGREIGDLPTALRKPSPRALRRGRLLYTASGRVGAVDLRAGRVMWERRLGFRAGATLAGDGVVWTHSSAVHQGGDRVSALRFATGRVVTSGVVAAFGSTGIAVGAGRIAVATAGGRLLVLTPFAT
jgi:outer membrane protein assembly factor BamB